jgi:small conductance mechanosensitive channel
MMEETVRSTIDQVVAIITTYGLSVLGAIAILVIGWMASKWVSSKIYKTMSKMPKADETLNRFFSSLVRYSILIFTGLAVLSQFGIQTASLIAVLGAAGLAIGLALQGTLSHVASGVMLLIFRPFKIGDFIEAGGQAGTVKTIGLFMTELATPENVHIIVPNGKIWDTVVKNYSHNSTRRVTLTMGIGYDDSMDDAMKIIMDTLKKDKRILKDPEPMTAVSELADSSVNFTVRAWCDKGDYWPLTFDLNKTLKENFDKKGISIPYPQRDLHIVSGNETAIKKAS